MQHRYLTLCAVGFVLAASAAQAAEKGFILGASVGISSVDGTAHAELIRPQGSLPTTLSIDGLPFDADDASMSGFVGYNLNRYMGVELGYSTLGEFQAPRLINGSIALSADAWTLTARFRYPLVKSLEAQWSAGACRFQFDADGGVSIPPFFPFSTAPSQLTFETPDDRTGYHWGFGFGWQFNSHLGTTLGYQQHKSSVIDIETVNLGLTWSF